jgi:hypothetical protein
MEYGLVNKKIAILCAPENALWRALYPNQDITVSKDCKKVLGCGFQTLMNWIKGQPPRKELLNRLCETINVHELENIRVTLSMFEDSYDIYEFGSKLGLAPTDCEKAIDERLYHNTPLLPGFYFPKEDANIYYTEYKGVYFTYHYSRSQDGANWLARSALRVLYVLRINSYHTLRCKLHVPSLEDGHFFEYNGFLSARGNHLYWLFEERLTSPSMPMSTSGWSSSTSPPSLGETLMTIEALRSSSASTWCMTTRTRTGSPTMRSPPVTAWKARGHP